MAKVKKSFFERLTGSSNVREEEDRERQFEQSDQEDRMSNLSKLYEDDSDVETEMALSSNSRELPDEDDNEGQLTIDVYQTDNDIIIKSTIAGVKPEDLDVNINNDMVTIRGERKTEEEVSEENYYYQECYWGSFSRSVILPVDVISDKAEASMKNGILTIRLPKADVNKAKKIQVRGF